MHTDDPNRAVTHADLKVVRAECHAEIAELRVELLKWNTVVLIGVTAIFAEIVVILKLWN